MAKKKPTKFTKPAPHSRVKRGAVELLPSRYAEFLDGLKARIRNAQVWAALAVNPELIALYWEIGRAVVEQQQAERWGRSIIERLAKDLQVAFPGVGGFSPSNVWRMRGFYLAYTAEVRNLAQPVREMDGSTLPIAVAEIPWGLGRIGQPQDIAPAVVFLASADSGWITGETLTISGGLR